MEALPYETLIDILNLPTNPNVEIKGVGLGYSVKVKLPSGGSVSAWANTLGKALSKVMVEYVENLPGRNP